MDATSLVDALCGHTSLTDLLAKDPHGGQPAIYQVQSSESDVLPRLAIFESDREYTLFADDCPIQERVQFTIDMFARDNIIRAINAALHIAMRKEGLRRIDEGTDDYYPDVGFYGKTVVYDIKIDIPFKEV